MMMPMSKVIAAAMLAGGILAGERNHEDPEHGHGPEWLQKIKAERALDPNKEHMFVHMISHSHDDVGWLKTVDEYYSGTR